MPQAAERWARVKELFQAAADLAPRERAVLLSKECDGDEALRREIESLLDSDNQVDGFIEQPAFKIPQDLFPEEEESLAGRQFGAYQIIREIGRGGLGAVYLAARADDEYRKEVAIKLIRRGLDTEDILRRFRNERQILAQLDHPNIARLIDGGTTDDGLPYFVMEYVNGEPIGAYCDAHVLNTTERLNLFRKVCAAVTYAHQNLVIHRDLKPSNILVATDGEPKLLDFGIAKLLSSEEEVLAQTMVGQKIMTPEYASPEQVNGERITTVSDVYSLGVLLYELLTGRTPYRLKTRTAEEISRAITEQEPERPSTIPAAPKPQVLSTTPLSPLRNRSRPGRRIHFRRGARHRYELRGDIDNIVLMAMRKEPARRYASVGQFSEDIRRHLEGLPVIARKDTWSYRSGKFVRRHRVGVAAALVVALSLLGGIVGTLVQARTAHREKAKAEAISAFLQRMLTASDPNRHTGATPTVKDILDDASKRLASAQLADQPEVRAELQRTIGVTYLSIGQYALAEQNLSAALQTQTKLFGEDGVETLKTAAQLATLWGGSTGDYAKTDRFYRQKLPLLRAAQKNGTLSADYVISALNSLALLRRAQGDSHEAELLLREEVALGPQVSAESNGDIGIAETILALTLADQGKFPEAIKILREKLAHLRSHAQPKSPELCATLTGLGSFLLENSEFSEAQQNLHEAELIYRELYDPANMQLGDNLRLQAQALYMAHRYAEAEAKIDETLRIYRAASTPQYLNYATALMAQGLIYSETGNTAEAEKLLREAVQIRAVNMSATHFLRAMTEGTLGEFLSGQKNFVEAESLLLGSYKSLEHSQDPQSPRIRRARERLVRLYEAWDKPEEAAKYRAFL